MTITLIILKLIMFSIIVVGPVMIGRHIVQAAKGNQLQPASAPAAAAAAETEDAA
jgi:hypothetical protein